MTVSAQTIDRIVANVLRQLREEPARADAGHDAPSAVARVEAVVTDRVVTAETLLELPKGVGVLVSAQAIVTPAAWDTARERGQRLSRQPASTKAVPATADHKTGNRPAQNLAVVVATTPELEQLLADLSGGWPRRLLGCPDEAAALTVSEICRGAAKQVVIAASQPHRAACLANRNDRVKAVAIGNAGDVKQVRQQLRANVWCVDPAGKSYFEFKNLFREIVQRAT